MIKPMEDRNLGYLTEIGMGSAEGRREVGGVQEKKRAKSIVANIQISI